MASGLGLVSVAEETVRPMTHIDIHCDHIRGKDENIFYQRFIS